MSDIIDAVKNDVDEVICDIKDVITPIAKPFTMSFTEEGIKLLWKVLSVMLTNPIHPFNVIETALIAEIKDSIVSGIGPVLQQMAAAKGK